jgi:hypothetical protein
MICIQIQATTMSKTLDELFAEAEATTQEAIELKLQQSRDSLTDYIRSKVAGGKLHNAVVANAKKAERSFNFCEMFVSQRNWMGMRLWPAIDANDFVKEITNALNRVREEFGEFESQIHAYGYRENVHRHPLSFVGETDYYDRFYVKVSINTQSTTPS